MINCELKKAKISRGRGEYTQLRRKAFQKVKHKRNHQDQTVGEYEWQIQRLVIDVPEILDLEKNRDATLEIARACRTNCIVQKKRTLLDFRNTKNISSSAVLYLVAEIDRCRKVCGVHMLTGTYPRDKKLKRQMRDCGFYDVLGVTCDLPNNPDGFPIDYIKVRSGALAEGRLAREVRVALLGSNNALLEREKSRSFFRALSEAMTNVVHHAYPADWDPSPIKVVSNGFWMLGHINRRSKVLKIMIVDQGIGIPRSLPRTHKETFKEMLRILGLPDQVDGSMILAAMEIGRSRLELNHRGKGLNDLKQIIDICQTGTLRILSKKGEYLYKVKAGVARQSAETHRSSLSGTLVEWSLPLHAILPLLSLEDEKEET